MAHHKCKGLAEFGKLFNKHIKAKAKRVQHAVEATAREGANHIRRETVPVAFGELRDSIHVTNKLEGARIVSDAPHSQGVEIGQRPHWPDIDALERWVKLRASQGLLSGKRQGRLPGITTSKHAKRMAGEMKRHEADGAIASDAPRRIAQAIAKKISEEGTEPQWFMHNALPFIREVLGRRVKSAMKDG